MKHEVKLIGFFAENKLCNLFMGKGGYAIEYY